MFLGRSGQDVSKIRLAQHLEIQNILKLLLQRHTFMGFQSKEIMSSYSHFTIAVMLQSHQKLRQKGMCFYVKHYDVQCTNLTTTEF